ncbi:hypothetical protein A0H81_00578 [Grifola frondosa]|uniref:Uncharacterized protein n=1 Tax=Grifola frondosa TaxID=5627 RepID=A0A1C7MPT2_GRIFR|nr:hypothetical protein A0H81_00578 [Grifola frondosa]
MMHFPRTTRSWRALAGRSRALGSDSPAFCILIFGDPLGCRVASNPSSHSSSSSSTARSTCLSLRRASLATVSAPLMQDGSNSSSKLSTSAIIAIAVCCGCVAVLVFSLFLWRLIARCCRRDQERPLPPVQPLAHHREQQLTAFAEHGPSRPATWFDAHTAPRASSQNFLQTTDSDASLIHSSPGPSSPSRENSWNIEDATSAESSSPYQSPFAADSVLPMPNPSFFPIGGNPHNSMASVSSSAGSSEATFPPATCPSSFVPFSESTSSLAHGSVASSPCPQHARSQVRSVSRSRPMSLASSAGTMYTSHSMHTLRGAPHAPHSNIQIVLPTPSHRNSTQIHIPSSGRVAADQWVLAGMQPPSQTQVDRPRSTSAGPTSFNPRGSLGPRPRSSLSQSTSASSSRITRRAQSQPRFSSSPSPSPTPSMTYATAPPLRQRPPPVPRIPSSFGNLSYSVPEEADEFGRGRSRKSVLLSSPQQLPPQLQTEMSLPEQPHKLHKPRPTSQVWNGRRGSLS